MYKIVLVLLLLKSACIIQFTRVDDDDYSKKNPIIVDSVETFLSLNKKNPTTLPLHLYYYSPKNGQ